MLIGLFTLGLGCLFKIELSTLWSQLIPASEKHFPNVGSKSIAHHKIDLIWKMVLITSWGKDHLWSSRISILSYFRIFLSFLNVCVCVYVCGYVHLPSGACEQRHCILLELELHSCRHLTWVLGIELLSSAKQVCSLNHRAIPLATQFSVFLFPSVLGVRRVGCQSHFASSLCFLWQ